MLITVMSRNGEVYKIVDYVCCIQPVQANGTNPNILRKRTVLVKYSIGRKSAYGDSFDKPSLLGRTLPVLLKITNPIFTLSPCIWLHLTTFTTTSHGFLVSLCFTV
jgi:hypothetical protein